MAFNTVSSATTALSQSTSVIAAAPVSATSSSQPALWDPPKWIIGLALSWFAFAFTLAGALIMSQWWAETKRKSMPQRGRRKNAERQGERGLARFMSSAIALGDADGRGFRKRKPRGLSVDGQVRDTVDGLGISVFDGDGKGTQQGKVKKRVSFDSWEAATAPLPSTKAFPQTLEPADTDFDDDEIVRYPDIETRHPMPNTRDLCDQCADRRASPYFDADASLKADGEADGEVEGEGWLRKVNQGVYKVADKLSATFYDKVNGAEDGLLLPVREYEREGFMGKMVR